MQLRRLAIVGTAIAALGALVIGVTLIDGSDESSDALPNVTTDFSRGHYTGDLLVWSARDRLAVCVEFGGSAETESGITEVAAVAAIEAALTEVSKNMYWMASQRLKEAASASYAEYGCPVSPSLVCPTYNDVIVTCPTSGEHVSVPSRFKTFAYVMTKDDFARATGLDQGFYAGRRGPGEVTCEGDSCAEVTGVVYLTTAELEDQERLTMVLLEGMGLIEPGPPPVEFPTATATPPHPR